MAHRIMNEINLISAINALVVSKFGRPRNRGDFMFIIIDSWVLLPLSVISPRLAPRPLSLLLHFHLCHNEQRPPRPDAWVCPGLDCFAFRNQISSLRFPFRICFSFYFTFANRNKTDSWRSPLARPRIAPWGWRSTVQRALSHHWGVIVFARRPQLALCNREFELKRYCKMYTSVRYICFKLFTLFFNDKNHVKNIFFSTFTIHFLKKFIFIVLLLFILLCNLTS